MIFEPEQKLFVSELTQSVIAWFLSVWSSCCLMVAATLFSGVADFGLTLESGSITNQPYCELCTGAWTTFVFSVKATLLNSGTVWPCSR